MAMRLLVMPDATATDSSAVEVLTHWVGLRGDCTMHTATDGFIVWSVAGRGLK